VSGNPPTGYPRVTPYFAEQIREPDPEWRVYSSDG
jgi:hypothetical protein